MGIEQKNGRFRKGGSRGLAFLAIVRSILTPLGEVAERLNAPDSKSGMAFGSSGVRIPPSPLR